MADSLQSLFTSLLNRSSAALKAADQDGDGVIKAQEQGALPADLRPLTENVAQQLGGELPIDTFQQAYSNWISDGLLRADANGDYTLQKSEEANLSAPLYANIVALRAELAATAAPVSTPAPAPAPSTGAPFGISGVVPASAVTLTVIQSTKLSAPSGLAFHPSTGALWVVNRGDDTTLVIEKPGTGQQKATRHKDDSDHFMNNPTGLAFSRSRNEFATSLESINDYNGQAPGNMFTGVTLWPGTSLFDGGSASHLDMLHHSPNSMGIAAGRDSQAREYWLFNGDAGSIDRYWFYQPHAPGAHDHSDGVTVRYGAGQLARVAGVPSHLAYDDKTDTLFIADTGNGRIAKLDAGAPTSAATAVAGYHNETPLYAQPGSPIKSVPGTAAQLSQPSGLILHNDHLVASDHATGKIKAFSKDGTFVGEVDTGRGSGAITGLAAGPDGRLYFLDAKRDEVVALTIP